MHILSIVGARPNFMKIAPIAWEAGRRKHLRHTIIHTGQHYDEAMSHSFFETLDIPRPDVNLGIGSFSHGVQTGKIMMGVEPVFQELKPDWVITVGDVNSTAAASLVAVKLGIRCAHVEAGLRSFDRTMPEEINRLVTDAICDLLLVTEQAALDNLKHEGIPDSKVVFTGNVMIDSLVHNLPRARELAKAKELGLQEGDYILVTMHRPSNVDDPAKLEEMTDTLVEISRRCPVFFPVHPRTRNNLEAAGLWARLEEAPGMMTTGPLDYLSFISLVTSAKALLTDSGGIQEETTYLGLPCLTMRPNTERPSTIDLGTNELVEPAREPILEAIDRLLDGKW
ncbi:MAG: UDP-N-acetylglucosamine 2-epimerase (non-hydrolyzing), partial [Spirochaetales bacterium]|nr:UDP-N-acetylglucosamine 2-epimerase (non-hydrolyzing) [Spirochaetales bacterium]